MARRRFIPDFMDGRIPYLGMPDGMIFEVDVPDLPPDTEAVWLTKKTKGIEQLIKLKHLKCIHAPLREDWLPIFAKLPRLQRLKLSLPKTPDIPSLKCLTQLRTLIVCCNRHQENLEFVRGLDQLHSLCVSEAVAVKSLDPLSSLTELREIYLDGKMGKHVVLDSFEPLSELTHLQYAVLLVRLAKENRSLTPLHTLKKLSHLYLATGYPPAEYDATLAALPKLKEIHFNGMKRWPPT